MSRSAIYPGSFDPLTYGHIDVIKRACAIFDEVIVAVAQDTQKEPLFSPKERREMVEQATTDVQGVRTEIFKGLVTDYAREKGIYVLIRGLRMISDFEFEFQMALTNRRLNEEVETVFLMPSEGYSFISSTLLKEAAALGGDVTSFVPGFIAEKLKEKFKR